MGNNNPPHTNGNPSVSLSAPHAFSHFSPCQHSFALIFVIFYDSHFYCIYHIFNTAYSTSKF